LQRILEPQSWFVYKFLVETQIAPVIALGQEPT
jgi:hypothetical protein